MSQRRIFLEPVFKGQRYADHAVPVDVLPELAAYRDLVVEVAKALWLEQHNDRKRVPKGFIENFRIVMHRVEPGSAVPVLEREGGDPADEFEQARDLIANCVEAVSQGRPPPEQFPRALLSYFNNFGKRLHEGESIELRGPGAATGPSYSPEVRKKLVLDSSATYARETAAVGSVFSADMERAGFRLRLEQGTEVSGRFQASMADTILRAMHEHTTAQVKVVGIGLFDKNDVLQRFDEVMHITPVDSGQDLLIRVRQLMGLSKGWLGQGEGEPLDASGAEWAADVLRKLAQKSAIGAPAVYPTPDGGLQAEWTSTEWEVSMTFNLASKAAFLQAVSLDGDEKKDLDLTLSVVGNEATIEDFVSRYTREA